MTSAPDWLRVVREPSVMSPERRHGNVRVREPQDVVTLLEGRASVELVEVFYVILLNQQNAVIGCEEVTRGLLNCALVHPREVFRAAILCSAASLIVAHNHPSGDPTPSAEDDTITRQLQVAGKLLDIPLLDHIVLGRGSYLSYSATGRMKGGY